MLFRSKIVLLVLIVIPDLIVLKALLFLHLVLKTIIVLILSQVFPVLLELIILEHLLLVGIHVFHVRSVMNVSDMEIFL